VELSGAWVFRGTRMPVATIFENLEDGLTIDEIVEQFDVTREQITEVLEFAARSLEAPVNRQCKFRLTKARRGASRGHSLGTL
jgi:uncharacterized protein (DUF433 family)